MTEKLCLNAASLNLVRPELLRLIKQAQAEFANVLQAGAEQQDLESCTGMLAQIDAVFRLIELGDAARLARELRELLQSDRRALARSVAVAGQAFAALVRYPDYLAGRVDAVPELLLDAINEIRFLLGRPPLAETHFRQTVQWRDCLCPGQGQLSAIDTDSVRRLRHLYQIGLLGMIRGNPDTVHVRLMQRAAERMLRITGGGEPGELWWLLGGVLEGLGLAEIGANAARNQLLSQADREFRRLLKQPTVAELLSTELRTQFVMLLARCTGAARIADIRQYLAELPCLPGDQEIARERDLLMGPAADQVRELGQALQLVLPGIRATVESMESGDALSGTDLEHLCEQLRSLVDKLDDCGFEALARPLSQQLASTRAADGSEGASASECLPGIADQIVRIETVLQALGDSSGVARALREQSHCAAGEIGGEGMLDDARRAAASNTREVLESVKRDLSAFSDAGFDTSHLAPSEAQLKSVAGALVMLGHAAAGTVARDTAGVLARSARDGMATDPETFVEALADVLICLEYYLAAIANAEQLDPIMLDVARQSLGSLRPRD